RLGPALDARGPPACRRPDPSGAGRKPYRWREPRRAGSVDPGLITHRPKHHHRKVSWRARPPRTNDPISRQLRLLPPDCGGFLLPATRLKASRNERGAVQVKLPNVATGPPCEGQAITPN